MPPVPTLTMNDGRAIPQFGLGVWQVSDDDATATVRYALELGYRHIDTAALYHNETGVGRAIQDAGIPREDLFITTKLWNDRHTDAAAACRESLDKLGMEYVDLYLIHWPAPRYGQFQAAWESLIELRQQGLARSIGVSNFTVADLDTLLGGSDVVPAVNQIELHPTFAQRELRAKHAQLGILTEAWSPLGQAKELQRQEVIDVAREAGITPAQAILRWHLQQGVVVFPKSVTPARIKENFEALDVTLTPEQLARLDALDEGNRIGPDPTTTEF